MTMKTSNFRLLGLILLTLCLLPGSALAAMPSFVELVKSASPAVVNISTERTETIRRGPGFGLFPRMPGFEGHEEFFEEFYRGFPEQSRKRSSLGSGFIISSDGYIVTNNHVVEGADTINVTMEEKKKEKNYTATVIGTDPDTDLALLKIEANNLPSLEFGDSDALQVGEWLIAIGNPLGLDHSVTAGILSAKGRNIQSGNYDDFLQTDASINPGNSGGPLLNLEGKVIGINTAIANRAQGIGFAIPSSLAKKIISDLKQHKKVSRGWLGVIIQNVDETTAKALGLSEAKGVLIGDVREGEPASKAGIKPGDVIIAIDGKDIETTDQLMRHIALVTPGTKTHITALRNGKKMEFTVTVSERDKSLVAEGDDTSQGQSAATPLGLTVKALTKEEVDKLNLRQGGVIVTNVQGESIARKAGIRPQDIILSVNQKAVTSAKDLQDEVTKTTKKKGALLLHVARGNSIFFVAIDLNEK